MAQAQLQNAPIDVEMSYATLCRKVNDIDSSVQWCRDVGLLANTMDCPKCGTSCREVPFKKASEQKMWRCPRKGCELRCTTTKVAGAAALESCTKQLQDSIDTSIYDDS